MNRFTNYCGKWIKHSGWYPDIKVRIFKKKEAFWGHENPHERLILPDDARIVHLDCDLLHYSYYTVEEHISRSAKYAKMAAKTAKSKGKCPYFGQASLSAVTAWLKIYVLKMGFLDGKAGWNIAWISAREKWLKYTS